ncbi:MAG: hypothetical protein GX422_13155 [Deltaproteobacteria bacterium]|nr:hypothetical protein [Deltaproteobacteria bacterium]
MRIRGGLDQCAAPRSNGSRGFFSVFLLGTVHWDPLGFRRLSTFLEWFNPDCILLEFSPYGLSFRRKNQETLQRTLNRGIREVSHRCGIPHGTVLRHPEVLAVRRQISLPFEYRATSRFSKRTGTPLFLVDHSQWSRRWISEWPELLSWENIYSLVALKSHARESISQIYHRAASLIGTGGARYRALILGFPSSNYRCRMKRERYLAKRIVRILETHVPKKPLFVGGWNHLVRNEDHPTIRQYLATRTTDCGLLDRTALTYLPSPDPAFPGELSQSSSLSPAMKSRCLHPMRFS